jgi:uncharacterized protein YprB with RNaseH-like and TPR domain
MRNRLRSERNYAKKEEDDILYLDIETSFAGKITIIGILSEKGKIYQMIATFNREVVISILKDVRIIYTYNGLRFDIPKLKQELGLEFSSLVVIDLMYLCWAFNLYGGLKRIEEKLHIPRKYKLSSYEAMVLWDKWIRYKDKDSLDLLLEYNKEDLINLKILKDLLFEKLKGY